MGESKKRYIGGTGTAAEYAAGAGARKIDVAILVVCEYFTPYWQCALTIKPHVNLPLSLHST